jgi:hypothetical protein
MPSGTLSSHKPEKRHGNTVSWRVSACRVSSTATPAFNVHIAVFVGAILHTSSRSPTATIPVIPPNCLCPPAIPVVPSSGSRSGLVIIVGVIGFAVVQLVEQNVPIVS